MAFNSREYRWGDYEVLFNGVPILKLRGLIYKRSVEKEPVYARGDEPLDIVSGNRSYEGTLSVLLSGLFEMETVLNAAGVDLMDAEFMIIASYIPKSGIQQIVVKRLNGCQFEEIEEGLKQGDKFKEVDLPFKFLSLK